MKRPILKIIYLLILGLMIYLTIKTLVHSKGAPEELKSKVTVLEEAKILPENEGKLVQISGKLASESELKFENLGVNVKTPILKRTVEMYQYTQDNPGEIVKKEWSDDEPISELTNEKINKTYYNPNKKMDDETIYGEANIGEFIINKDLLKKLKPNSDYTDLKALSGYYVEDGRLTTYEPGNLKLGDLRISFKYLNLENMGEYTFIGKQSGKNLVEYKLDTGLPLLEIHEGKLNLDQVLSKMASSQQKAKYTSFIILGLIIVIGIFVFKPAKIKENQN